MVSAAQGLSNSDNNIILLHNDLVIIQSIQLHDFYDLHGRNFLCVSFEIYYYKSCIGDY